MKGALALSDYQLLMVKRAAAALPARMRDGFLRGLAERLIGQPSDAAVNAAINVLLDRAVVTPAYLCDGASVPNKEDKP